MEEAGLAHHTPCGHQEGKAGLMALSSRGGNWGCRTDVQPVVIYHSQHLARPTHHPFLHVATAYLVWGNRVKLRLWVWLWRGGLDGGDGALQVSL